MSKERIIDVNSNTQYELDMRRYALYVSRYRVMPNFLDGLKPVQRRILYAAYKLHAYKGNKLKSNNIVGETMGKYHPHGDASIYGAMKTMVNWFDIYMPLLSPQGSWGSVQGDGAAAARYTEACLSDFCWDTLIGELNEAPQIVNWIETFDSLNMEPEYLPAALPIAFINGSYGIGTGIKVEIPKHNIVEVIDLTLKLLDDPEIPIVLIPDHCQCCEIINTDWKKIAAVGQGSYRIRGIIDIETIGTNPALVIKSTPDLVSLNNIVESIHALIEKNKIVNITKMIEETTKDPKTKKEIMRYVILLKKGSDPMYVRDMIYKNTQMEKSCRVNVEALDGITPIRLSYRDYFIRFINARIDIKQTLYAKISQASMTRLHEISTYITLLKSGDIDNIIRMIRKQNPNTTDEDTVEYLIKKLKITDVQAKFVLNIDLKKLSPKYLNRYLEEAEVLKQRIQDCADRFYNPELIKEEIRQELITFRKKYYKPRNCRVISEPEASAIPEGEFKVIITTDNYIKKIPVNENIGASLRGRVPKMILNIQNTDSMLIFDELGKVYKLPVHKIPFADRNSSGFDIRILIKNLTSDISAVMYESKLKDFTSDYDPEYFMVVVTEQGLIKRMDIDDFLNVPPSGIFYTKVDQGDKVKNIIIVNKRSDIVVYASNKAIRLRMDDIPHLKRNTKGSKAMNTTKHIDGISVIIPNATDILVVTANGRANKISQITLQPSIRARAGSKLINLGKTDTIKGVFGVKSTDILQITTKSGNMNIPVSDIPTGSSASGGFKLPASSKDPIFRCRIVYNK